MTRAPRSTPTLPLLVAALLACGCASEPELQLSMFTTDEYCTATQLNLEQTQSLQLAVVANAGFSANEQLDGCLVKRQCFKKGKEFFTAKSLAALAGELEASGVTLKIPAGDNLAVIVTGFRNTDCAFDANDVTLCGQAFIDSFPEEDATITLLTACSSGTANALFCNPAQRLNTCP